MTTVFKGELDDVVTQVREDEQRAAEPKHVAQADLSGDSVPSGTGQYKVLQLDASNNPVWDWVKAH